MKYYQLKRLVESVVKQELKQQNTSKIVKRHTLNESQRRVNNLQQKLYSYLEIHEGESYSFDDSYSQPVLSNGLVVVYVESLDFCTRVYHASDGEVEIYHPEDLDSKELKYYSKICGGTKDKVIVYANNPDGSEHEPFYLDELDVEDAELIFNSVIGF